MSVKFKPAVAALLGSLMVAQLLAGIGVGTAVAVVAVTKPPTARPVPPITSPPTGAPEVSEQRSFDPAPAEPGVQPQPGPAVVPGAPSPPPAGADPAPGRPGAPAVAAVPPAPPRRPGEEVLERRTASSKTFATATPGRMLTKTFSQPVHYRNAGRWEDLDMTLVGASSARRLQPKASPLDVELGTDNTDAALATIRLDPSHRIEFSLREATPGTARVEGASVVYPGIRPGADLRLTPSPSGLKEDIVLASRQAPDTFVFPLRLVGLTASLDPSGDVVYTDASGTERARTPKGFMEDAGLGANSGEGATTFGVTYDLIDDGSGGQALRVSLDRDWLDDPARVYPVTVDPSYWNSTTLEDDTFVKSNFSRDNAFDSELAVGTYDSGGHVAISFMNFDVSGLNGKVIDSATLQVHEVWSWSCSPRGMGVYRSPRAGAGTP